MKEIIIEKILREYSKYSDWKFEKDEYGFYAKPYSLLKGVEIPESIDLTGDFYFENDKNVDWKSFETWLWNVITFVQEYENEKERKENKERFIDSFIDWLNENDYDYDYDIANTGSFYFTIGGVLKVRISDHADCYLDADINISIPDSDNINGIDIENAKEIINKFFNNIED